MTKGTFYAKFIIKLFAIRISKENSALTTKNYIARIAREAKPVGFIICFAERVDPSASTIFWVIARET